MKTKPKHNDEAIYSIQNAWQLIAYLIKRCKIEICLILFTAGFVTIAITSVSYNKIDKLTIKPTIDLKDLKDLKTSKEKK